MGLRLKLAYHAITWGADTLGALKDISDFGFRGVECFSRVADQYADNPELFRRVLSDHGLQLVALYGGGKLLTETRDADVADNRRLAEFIAAVGGDRMMIGGGDRRRDAAGRDHFSDDDVRAVADTLNEIGAAALEVGVRACYHPHIHTIGEERAHVDQVFALTDPSVVFAGPDPAHLLLGGYEPREFFERYAERIAYLHLKNVPAQYTATNWREASQPAGAGAEQAAVPLFAELPEGQIDLRELVLLLEQRGYEGWVTTEIDVTTRATPRESVRLNAEFWRGLGARVGEAA